MLNKWTKKLKCKNLEKQTNMAELKNENNAGDLNGLMKKGYRIERLEA